MTGMSRIRPTTLTSRFCPARRLKTRMLTMTKTTRNSVPQRGWAVGWRRMLSMVRAGSCSSAGVVLCSAPWGRGRRPLSPPRLADEEQVGDEDGHADEPLDQVLDEGLCLPDRRRRGLGQEERQQHEEPDGEAEGEHERPGDGTPTELDPLRRRRDRPGAHEPAGADDQRLIEQDHAPEERRSREAAAMEDGVQRLRGRGGGGGGGAGGGGGGGGGPPPGAPPPGPPPPRG